jgi:hypothetical protein
MPAQWPDMHIRKARKKDPGAEPAVHRVSTHPTVLLCSILTPSPAPRKITRLDNQFMVMQSQIIGIQSSLDKILKAVQPAPSPTAEPSSTSKHAITSRFPPLPGFAPPPHKYATYGIVPSTAASSDDESEDTLPRSSINAPIEALQGLANAAAEAASASIDVPRYASPQ